MTPLLYFSVNLAFSFFFFFFFTAAVKESISQFHFVKEHTWNNQPCNQAILGIIEHRSTDRKQIQAKDMAQSHTDMELYKLNVSQLL